MCPLRGAWGCAAVKKSSGLSSLSALTWKKRTASRSGKLFRILNWSKQHLNPSEVQLRSITTFRGNRKSIQEWHLVVSRGPELENNATRSRPNSTISRRLGKYRKRWQRRKSFKNMERPIGIEPTPEPWQICSQWKINNLRVTFRNTK
jgi:hypothetical protein